MLQAVQRLCAPGSPAAGNATGTTTGTSASETTPKEKISVAKTTEAPDRAGASSRAGDRGRTGDVQLGNLIDEGPEDYDPWA
jgi:hypothetical protein